MLDIVEIINVDAVVLAYGCEGGQHDADCCEQQARQCPKRMVGDDRAA
jgi:hypothetical protein